MNALQEHTDNLNKSLRTINGELQIARGNLQLNVENSKGAGADQLAQAVTTLEARRDATIKAIEKAEAEATNRAALFASKEYRDAMKEIVELEKFFEKEAASVYADFLKLLERATLAKAHRDHYRELVYQYCLDADNTQKANKLQNKHYLMLVDFVAFMAKYKEQRDFIANADEKAAQIAGARMAARSIRKAAQYT